MVTPPSSEATLSAGRKRSREPITSPEEIAASASPILKKGRESMKRTPQPNLTQSRLTGSGMLQLQGGQPAATGAPPRTEPQPCRSETGKSATSDTPAPPMMMETAPPEGSKQPLAGEHTGTSSTLVSTDFLLKSLQLNTEQIIKSFTSNLGALALKIDSNTMKIDDNAQLIKRQAEAGEADREIKKKNKKKKLIVRNSENSAPG